MLSVTYFEYYLVEEVIHPPPGYNMWVQSCASFCFNKIAVKSVNPCPVVRIYSIFAWEYDHRQKTFALNALNHSGFKAVFCAFWPSAYMSKHGEMRQQAINLLTLEVLYRTSRSGPRRVLISKILSASQTALRLDIWMDWVRESATDSPAQWNHLHSIWTWWTRPYALRCHRTIGGFEQIEWWSQSL